MRYRLIFVLMIGLIFAGCSTKKPVQLSVDSPNPIVLQSKTSPYLIRTRIVVEQARSHASRSLTDVISDLSYTEELYKDLPIKFIIVKIETAFAEQDWENYLSYDAAQHPDCLNIYYCYGRQTGDERAQSIKGVGSFPWFKISSGIVIHSMSSGPEVLAHEVGHFFGLFHTFQKDAGAYNDMVSDTLSPDEYEAKNPGGSYPSYNNIMNYHWFGSDSFVTAGQIERMRCIIETEKKNVIIKSINSDDWVKPSLLLPKM